MTARHDSSGSVSASQRKAADKYQKAHIQTLTVKLNTNTDADIIRFLAGCDNKQGLIKQLIRAEMEILREAEG